MTGTAADVQEALFANSIGGKAVRIEPKLTRLGRTSYTVQNEADVDRVLRIAPLFLTRTTWINVPTVGDLVVGFEHCFWIVINFAFPIYWFKTTKQIGPFLKT